MKNKLSVFVIILTMSGLMVTAARAGGGPPPGPPHPHNPPHFHGGPVFFPSVSFVIGDPAPVSRSVTLVGHVYRQVGDDTYLFTDGTSTFQLDSDDSNLPIGAPIIVHGQFAGDAEINVNHWHYVE